MQKTSKKSLKNNVLLHVEEETKEEDKRHDREGALILAGVQNTQLVFLCVEPCLFYLVLLWSCLSLMSLMSLLSI